MRWRPNPLGSPFVNSIVGSDISYDSFFTMSLPALSPSPSSKPFAASAGRLARSHEECAILASGLCAKMYRA